MRILLSQLVMIAFLSCKTVSIDSETLVDGKFAKVTTAHTAVVYLESPEPCTGTFVGRDTIIAAAHCAAEDGTVTYVDSSGSKHKSSKIWHHGITGRQVLSSLLPNAVQRDFIIAKFTNVNAPSVIKMGFRKLKAGESVLMIGYSISLRTPDYKRGDKVSDQAKIAQVGDRGVLFKGFPAVNGGDSGGPLLNLDDSKVYGVVSFGQPEMRDADRTSMYGLLSHPENINLLHKAAREGASINESDLPPEVKFIPSSIKVKGKYSGFQVCSNNGVVNICNLILDLQSNSIAVVTGLSAMPLNLTYKQVNDQVLIARGSKPINTSDPKTFSSFKIMNQASILLGDDGAILTNGENSGGTNPVVNPNNPQDPNPTSPKMVCTSTDKTRTLTFVSTKNVIDKDNSGMKQRSFKSDLFGQVQRITITLDDGDTEIYLKQAHVLIPQHRNRRQMNFNCVFN